MQRPSATKGTGSGTSASHRPPFPKDIVRTIPDHQLLRCIGQGSYGEVWLARNMMGTYRAVKFVHRNSFKDDRPFERELEGIRKFEPVSRSHEGLVDVLHAGLNQDEGYFYYVMELGDDPHTGQAISPDTYEPKTLATELAQRGRLSSDASLQIGLALSHALAHLHKYNLVHRDIKPSNIIFVNDVPKLADIGLVVEVGEARSYVGTEGFIPPEGPGTAQSDLYGLGKVLYEISTGKDRREFPELPANLESFPDATALLELNEVIVKACQNNLTRRYQSAREMNADLVVLQNGRSVHRLRVLERRLQLLKKAAGPVLGGLLIGGFLTFDMAHRRQEFAEIRQRQVGSQLAYGTRALEEGDYTGALPFFVEALKLDEGNAARERTHRARIKAVTDQSPKLVQMFFQEGQISRVEFSPTGDQLLITGWFGKARIWDIKSGKPHSQPFDQEHLETAAFSPDGQFVVTANEAGDVAIWSAVTAAEVLRIDHPDRVMNARFSPGGRLIVTACRDKRARVFDAPTGQLKLVLGDHGDMLNDAEFSPDGRLVVTASRDKTAQIWDAETGRKVGPPLEHKNWVFSASFSPDGQRLVTASFDRKARQWDVNTQKEIPPAMSHRDGILSARFSPDGRYIVSACLDSTVRFWDASTGLRIDRNAVLRHSGRGVMYAVVAPDGHRIATGCTDGTTRVWDLAGSEISPKLIGGLVGENDRYFLRTNELSIQVFELGTDEKLVSTIALSQPLQEAMLSPNGAFVLTISGHTNSPGPGTLQVRQVASTASVSPPIPCTNSLPQFSLSHGGRLLVKISGTIISLIDVATGQSVSPELANPSPVAKVCFSADDRMLSATSRDSVQVFELPSGKLLFPKLSHASEVNDAQFSPDGRFLATCVIDSTVNEGAAYLWNAATGERWQTFNHRDGVIRVAFSPDSQRLVTASEDFTARVWEVSTGKPLTPPLRHEDQVQDASFSVDGRWIVTASSDRTARVWDAETGEPLTPPLRYAVRLARARFTRAGDCIVTSSAKGQSWFWDLVPDTRPVAELMRLSDLLAANPATEKMSHSLQIPIKKAWQSLIAQFPEQFRVPDQAILAWHLREAELSQANGNSNAADFHRVQSLTLAPTNQSPR
ncbi:MAG: serine/threonine protein kinase [Chloroflexi bacterium]|nr:serine/threonine protein kinase [Chloroflexota bacterium]